MAQKRGDRLALNRELKPCPFCGGVGTLHSVDQCKTVLQYKKKKEKLSWIILISQI